MNMFNGLRKLCVVLAAGLAWTGVAFAQANSIEAFDVAQQGGKVVVRITTKEPLTSVPPSFTVANPARIVFDFPGTTNALGRNAQDVGQSFRFGASDPSSARGQVVEPTAVLGGIRN